MKEHKPTKVIELLRHIDESTMIEVMEYNPRTEEEEQYYKGDVFGCPWWIADLYLDTDANSEAMYLYTDKDNIPYLGIYVREEA